MEWKDASMPSKKKSGVESVVTQTVKKLPAVQETQDQFLGQEDILDKGIVTHSTILAWRIQGTEELVLNQINGSLHLLWQEIIQSSSGSQL